MIIRSVVVLPHPDGASSTWISAASTAMLTSSTTPLAAPYPCRLMNTLWRLELNAAIRFGQI
ncbi:hypothetical protein WJ11_18550 [Burkholderia cenocepacia]|nr:hypothetical protein WJ11_18550 [Burkholderia cenocepacia]